jgi:radical SAM protein with 4Fe4S-binding SPASM domain
VALDLQHPDRITELKNFCKHFNGPVCDPDGTNRLYHCGAGVNSFAIDPSGRLSACVLSPENSYDLRERSFREGWEHFLLELRQKEITRLTKCAACGIKAMCGMCPANGELENRDAEEPVDFLCQVAHLRAYTFGIAVLPHGDCEYCQGGSRYGDLMHMATSLLKNV